MIRLEKSEVLQRMIRRDDPEDMAVPTFALVKQAIEAGRIDEALSYLDYAHSEGKLMHDILVAITEQTLTYIASFGEEHVEKFWKKRYYPRMKEWLSTTPGVKENLQRSAEYQRAHYGEFQVVEERDRYVLTCNPCGSGGRLRRTSNVGTTRKAYPWSWSKAGVPYYCTHCALYTEIIPIELRGYPIRINLIGDKPDDPCVFLFYKKPELIPEEYFTRVGKKKTIKSL